MISGKCFQFQCDDWLDSENPVLRQFRIFFCMKVDMDLEVDIRPALLVFSVLQTASEITTNANPLFYGPEHIKLWHSKQHRLENLPKRKCQLLIWE